MRTAADIENVFTYHVPVGDQGKKYDTIRSAGEELVSG